MIYITDLQKRCESFIKETHITITQFCILIELSREAFYSWVKGELTLSEETLARIERYLDSQDAKSLLEKSQKYLPVNECTKRVGLSAYKINSLCIDGIIDAEHTAGGRWMINIDDLQMYVQKHQPNRLQNQASGMLVFGELFSDFNVFWKPVLSCNTAHEIFFPDRHEYDNQYWISNAGYIYNDTTGELLGDDPDREGYVYVNLLKNKKYVSRLMHILVAYHFCPNGRFKEIVHHIDGNKQNNKASNLIWVTEAEHYECHRLMKKNKKEYRKYINQLKRDNKW